MLCVYANVQVREEVLKTIVDCEAAAEDLERQLEQRRFIVSFLRDFLSREARPRPPPRPVPRDRAPVPPVRLRHRARQPPSPANEQVDQLRHHHHYHFRLWLFMSCQGHWLKWTCVAGVSVRGAKGAENETP